MPKLIVAFLKFAKEPINQGNKTPAERKNNTTHCRLNTFQQTPRGGGGSGVWSAGDCTDVDKTTQATVVIEEESCER
jgi:hypothetical protein